jgi:hypothetical protein
VTHKPGHFVAYRGDQGRVTTEAEVESTTTDDATAVSAQWDRDKRRRLAFGIVVVLFLLMHVVLSPLPYAVLGWFLETGAISHRVHEICFGLVFVVTAVALVAQLRRPEQKIAAVYQVVVPLYLIILSAVLLDRLIDPVVFAFLVMPVVMVALHPARTHVLRPQTTPSPLLLGMIAVAAVPLVIFAIGQIREGVEASKIAPNVFEDLPDTATDKEIEDALEAAAGSARELEAARHYGHWSAMGAFAISIVGLGVVAGLRMPGWRLPAWATATALVVFGAASLTSAGDASALGTAWASVAIAGGMSFAAAAEYVHRH